MPTQQERRRRLQGGSNTPSVTIAGVQYGPDEIPEAFGIWEPQQTGNIEPDFLPGAGSSGGGGSRGAPSPQVSPQPSRGLTGDNSNAGLVNSTLFGNESNRQFWSTEDLPQSVTASAGGTRPLDVGFGAGLQGDYPFGEPTVQVPTSDATYPLDLDNAPSLFGGATPAPVNPFDQWWRQGDPTFTQGEASAGAALDLPTAGAGGSIWAEAPPVEHGMWNEDFSMGDLYFPPEPSSVPQENPNFNPVDEGTGIDIDPPELDQNYEWTTSPGDRRFLNTPGAEEAAPATEGGDPNAGRISSGGNTMSGFVGDLSLGGNLYTPFEFMNYGGGYPQVRRDGLAQGASIGYGGRPEDLNVGEGWIGTQDGGQWVERADGSGSDWRENASPNPRGEGNGRPNDGTGTTTIQIPTQQQGGLAGLTIIGHDTRNGQPIYRDGSGNLFVNPGTGTRISPGIAAAMGRGDYEQAYGTTARQAANSKQMSDAQANPIGVPKLLTPQSDRGRTFFHNTRTNADRPNDITFDPSGQIVWGAGRSRAPREGAGRNTVTQVGGLG